MKGRKGAKPAPVWLKVLRRSLLVLGTAVLALLLFVYVLGAVICYGPSPAARNLFIYTMQETSAAKFVPYLYFTPSRIHKLTDRSDAAAPTGFTDPNLVFETASPVPTPAATPGATGPAQPAETPPADTPEPTPDSPYGYFKISDRDGIELYEIRERFFNGNMMIVRDPSRVFVGKCRDQYTYSEAGLTLPDIATRYGAVAAVNGGGFEDAGGVGNGGIPDGLVITDGKLDWGYPDSTYELAGFTQNNVLIVGRMTAREALALGIRDALCYGPTLIMNGERVEANLYGSGVNPRTAIGQRRDGAVLLLVINGRQLSSLGCTYAELADIMADFGAINASNLDGGTSTVMLYEGAIVNKVLRVRRIPTGILVR